MSMGMTVVMLIASWLAIASAMLWGILRIARRHRHHPPAERPTPVRAAKRRRQRPVSSH